MSSWTEPVVPVAEVGAPAPAVRTSVLWRVDWLLVLAAAGLVVLGALLVWSATRSTHGSAYLKKDMVNAAVALVAGTVVALVDQRTWRAWVPVIFVLACLGEVVVLSPLGSTINGAHSWIVLGGGFTVEPSEFVKVALVMWAAMILAEPREGGGEPPARDVLLVLVLAAVPLGLILLQPDLGTSMVIGAMVLGVLAVAGVSWKWLVGLLVAVAALAVLAVYLHLLHSYQIQRFTTFLRPDSNTSAAAYQTHQARLAIGSGGLLGSGLFHGPQTNGGFVPEQQTDFVFTVAGEELGFVGGTAMIAVFGVVLWRGLRIARRAPDMFGRLVAVGVVCWFAAQGFENIGMTMGITPMTGIPLPLVSYGGSALFASAIGVGLLVNVQLATTPDRPRALDLSPPGRSTTTTVRILR